MTLWSQGVSEIISHELDEENCNHRLDRTKNCLVLDRLSLTEVLGFGISGLLFFLILSV